MYIVIYAAVSIFIFIKKTGLTINGNFCLFVVNGNWKQQTSVCLLQTEIENGIRFSPQQKQKTEVCFPW
jgi:hypothetical protein